MMTSDEIPLLERAGTRYDLVRRRPTVQVVEQLTPSFQRIVLGGSELSGWRSDGPADHVKVGFPNPGDGEVTRRDLTPVPLGPGDDGFPRLALDVVLHGDEAKLSRWALTVRPGDEIDLGGPRGSRLIPEGMDRLILVVDETALPAASRWLRSTPAHITVDVIAQAGDTNAQAYLDDVQHRGTRTWTYGDDRSGQWLASVRRLGALGPRTFVFAAGEATALIPIRRYVRDELGLRKDQLDVSGYWRRGMNDFDHHSPLDPQEPEPPRR